MQGGTAATQDVFIENVGQPILACIREAVHALQDLGMHREVQLIVSGGVQWRRCGQMHGAGCGCRGDRDRRIDRAG